MLAPLLLALATQSPATRPAPDVGALVDQVIVAYGGPVAIRKLDAYRLDGAVSAHVRGSEGRLRRDFVAPGKLRVDLAYPSRSEVRLLDGARGWRGDRSGQVEVTGMPYQAMEAQLLRSGVPWALVQHRAQLVDDGEREREGRFYRVLRYAAPDGLRVDYWVELQSHRVRRVEAVMTEGGLQLFFSTEYDDFRVVDGVLVPFVEQNYVRGSHAGTTHVESVRFGEAGLGPFAPVAPAAAPPTSPGMRL